MTAVARPAAAFSGWLLVGVGIAALLAPVLWPIHGLALLAWPATALLLAGFGIAIGARREPVSVMTSLIPVLLLTGLVWFLVTPLLVWSLATVLARPALPPLLLLAAGIGLALSLFWYGWPALASAARGPTSIGDLLAPVADQTGPPPLLRLPLAIIALAALLPLPMVLLLDRQLGDYRAELLIFQAGVIPLLAVLAAVWARREAVQPARVAVPSAQPLAEPVEMPVGLASPAGDASSVEERLYTAAVAGDVETALALLEAGADPHALPAPDDRDQRTLAMLAAVLPDLRLLRALIRAGVDLNCMQSGLTPLLAATRDSWHGRPEAITTLLANGADPRIAGSDGSTALHHAARSTDPAVAVALLDAGAEPNALDHARMSPLAVACSIGNWRVAKLLLDRGAASEPEAGIPAIVAAASGEDDPAGVVLLLRHKARVDAADEHGRTALHAAAECDNSEIVAALLSGGAAVGRADARGDTPMLVAARGGCLLALCTLAGARPDPGAQTRDGRNALALLAEPEEAAVECVELLLGLGVDPGQADAEGRLPIDHLIAAGRWRLVKALDPERTLPASLAEETATAEPSRTPLELLRDALLDDRLDAASEIAAVAALDAGRANVLFCELAGHLGRPAIDWLLDHGVDPDRIDSRGDSVPFRLLSRGREAATGVAALLDRGASFAGAGGLARYLQAQPTGHGPDAQAAEALALALLERGADPFAASANAEPCLQAAIGLGWSRLTGQLLQRGIDPNGRDRRGRSALHLASQSGDEPLVRQLIACGAAPERPTPDGQTAHGLALAGGHQALVRWLRWPKWKSPGRRLLAGDLPAAAMMGDSLAVACLLDLELDINARDAQGCTALLRACGGGHAEVVDLLLGRGADSAIAANTGATPLSAAISMRQRDIVVRLLAAGANPTQTLPGGITPLMLACALGFPELADALLSSGAEVASCDEQSLTALHCAAMYAFQARDATRARQLIDAVLSAGAAPDAATETGHTPLLLALGGRAEPGAPSREDVVLAAVDRLLSAGASLDARDNRGFGPLHLAALHGLSQAVRRLLAAGANPDQRDYYNRPPREIALLRGFVDIAAEFDAPKSPSMAGLLRKPED